MTNVDNRSIHPGKFSMTSKMQRPIPILLTTLAFAFIAVPKDVPAQQFGTKGRVIVISPEAKVQIAGKQSRPVATATVHSYSRTNGPWLWVDALWGWLNKNDVVPLDRAEDHYTEIIRSQKAANQPAGVALHQRGIARLALGKPQDALSDFEAAIQDGYGTANVEINRGNALVALGKADNAIEAFTAAIAKSPNNGYAFHARAAQLANEDFLDAALADAEKAVELLPKEAHIWVGRGVVRQKLGKYEEAIADFSKAIQLSPRYSQALSNRAYCLKKTSDFVTAARDYQAAIEINPNLAAAYNDYAWLRATCRKSAIRDAAAAVRLAEKAVDLTDRKNPQYLDTLAAAYAAQGDFEKAIATAEDAVANLDGADQFAADQRLQRYRENKSYIERD